MSETKSAGVPAGATHQCVKCGTFFIRDADGPVVVFVHAHLCRTEDMRPIAEVGPAPTTAARLGGANSSAEQLSGKATRRSHPYQPAMTLAEIGRDEELPESWTKRPAEQPGKAADPRPVCTARFTRNGKREVCGQPNCSDPDHRTQIAEDLRPAQPQAPAEPTQEQIEKATAVVANLWWPKSLHVALVGKIAAALAAEAAPLREECDRLARESGEARFCGLQNEQRLRRERDAGRAKAAERDARIATLEKALGSAASALDDAAKALAAKWQHPGLCSGQDAEELSKTGFWAGIGEVMAHTMRAARRARRAALGASE